MNGSLLCDFDHFDVPMQTPQRWMALHLLLDGVLARRVPGDVVELGCHAGYTSAMLQKTIDYHGQADARTLYLFDSFTGMPRWSS